MDVYSVAVTKETTAYILADSLEAAQADADEMSFDEPDFIYEETIHVGKAWADPDPEEEVWTGGPDGDWVPWSKARTA